jgi:hypothetical protein
VCGGKGRERQVREAKQRTALAHVQKQSGVRRGQGGLNVRVVEHNHGRLAAQLQRDALQVGLGRVLLDEVPHRGGPREGNLVHVGVHGQGLAGRGAVAGQDVHHALGKPGLLDERGHLERGQRSLLRGLDDDGAPGRQSRPELPEQHEAREVPRDDGPANAHGLAQRVHELLGVHRDGGAADLVRVPRVVQQALHHQVNVRRGAVNLPVSPQRLAVVQRLQLGQLLGVALDQLSQLEHQVAAARGRHLAPGSLGVKRAARRLYRQVDVGLIRFVHLANLFLVGGVEGGERFLRRGFHKLPIDEQASFWGCFMRARGVRVWRLWPTAERQVYHARFSISSPAKSWLLWVQMVRVCGGRKIGLAGDRPLPEQGRHILWGG